MPMTLISRTTLTTSAASVTFNSIPQTFQTLKLVVSVRTTDVSGGGCFIRPNLATTNFSERLLYGSGSAAASTSTTTQNAIVWMLANTASTTANTFANGEAAFPNYAGSTNKPVSIDSVDENNATAANQYVDAALWSNTSAITALQLLPSGGNFAANSTFSLYGLA